MLLEPCASPASIFNIHGNRTADVLEARRQLITEIGRNKPDFDQGKALKHIDTVLASRLELAEITKDGEFQDMIPQLVGNDVAQKHGTESLDDLLKYRVGNNGENKTVFAIIDRSARQIVSAIYVHRATMHDRNDNVDTILKTPCGPMEDTVHTLVCYSINSFKVPGTNTLILKGAGERLIDDLLYHVATELNHNIRVITASPFRNKAMEEHPNFHALTDDQQYAFVYKTALEMKDGVQLFHCRNGAKMGRINLHANVPGTEDYKNGGVIINYEYSQHTVVRAPLQTKFHICMRHADAKQRGAYFAANLMDKRVRDGYEDATSNDRSLPTSGSFATMTHAAK